MRAIVILAALFVAAQARSALHPSHHQEIHRSDVKGDYRHVPEIALPPAIAIDPPETRIVTGNTGSRGQFPYQAALYLNGQSFCGGSLISQRWVLTAAKCAHGITTFTVYLGASNLASTESGRVVITTRTKVIHSSYNANLMTHDIALINLGQDITLGVYIQPVPFASGSNQVNDTARLSAWGLASAGSTQVGNQLQYADLVVISNSECSAVYGLVSASTLCAVYANGASTCKGALGSPFVNLQTKKQIGILSYTHPRLCEEGAPIIFTRVTSYASWITANTGISATFLQFLQVLGQC